MLTQAQVDHLRSFVRDYLFQTASSSEQEWVKRFPRAAEHRWQHTLNVLGNAEAILAGENATQEDADVVRVAVYLHDVSMFTCDHEIHGQISAQIAEDYLARQGFQASYVARVKRAIAEHGTDLGPLPPDQQGDLFSWEGKVLLEADILDKLGASVITNTLLSLGERGYLAHEALAEIPSSPAMERAEIFKDFLWTRTGRAIGKQRFAFFLEFLDRLKEEIHEPDVKTAA